MKKNNIDMTNGPLFGKIVTFTIPIILSSLIQLLFNAADIIVIGQFEGKEAVSAVGSTGSLVNLCINMFIGLSAGVGVTVAQNIGAKDKENLQKTVHTAIAVSIGAGIILAIAGPLLAETLLGLMKTPDKIINLSALYLKIYFLSMPALMVYNFGASILRSAGDTKRPMYYLIAAGFINVIFNLIFVAFFHMSVAGVAVATAISQYFSAFMVFRRLVVTDEEIKLIPKNIRLHSSALKRIVSIGIPAGIQSSVFSISNVIIQSSINNYDTLHTLDSALIAGNSAAGNIEGFIYVCMNAFHQTSLTFSGQNLGAKKIERLNKILFLCLACVSVTGIIIGTIAKVFGESLLGLYVPGEKISIEYGIVRLTVFSLTYFLCGMMDVVNGSLRGMGCGLGPMLISLFFCCAARVFWVLCIFSPEKDIMVLYLSYPVTWSLALVAQIPYYIYTKKRIQKQLSPKVIINA
ncbi:MAG: MATE family efflux transporter [Ruminococcaceae bacterium]|nr:MATE family efflux transporter [Oscillospiraceae bacterium]